MPLLSRARRAFSRSRHTDRRPPQTEPLENRRLLADGAAGFGDDGWSAVAVGPGISAELKDLQRQADGKLVAAFSVYPRHDHTSTAPPPHHDFGVARFNPDGTLDTSFGGDGVVFTDLDGRSHDHPQALAVQSDGRIVVVGQLYHDGQGLLPDMRTAIVRYNPDGTLDGSFGDGGKVLGAAEDDNDAGTAVAIDGEGRIFVGVERRSPFGNAIDPGIWRYHADGSVDTSFGESGRAVVDLGEIVYGRVQALIPQPGGGVLAGALGTVHTSHFAEPGGLHLVKLDAAGRPDATFGGDGDVVAPRPLEELEDVEQLPDGRILVAGNRRTFEGPPAPGSARSHGVLAAYHPDGSPDTSFGDNGVTLVGDGTGFIRLNDLAVQEGGRLLVAGLDLTTVFARERPSGESQSFVRRFTADGRTDTTFGDDGSITFGDGQTNRANVWKVLPTADGILLGGAYARSQSDPMKLFIARFGPDGAGNTTPPAEDPPAVEAPDLSSNPPDYSGVYTEPPEGWTVNFSVHAYNSASLWLHGPDTDDTVRVTRNPTLPAAIDLDINGRVMTINFQAGPRVNWGISGGGGNDRIDVLLTAGAEFAGGGQLYGEDGNDILVNGDYPTLIVGGPGDDILVGGKAPDTLWGDDGVDKLYGMGGDDQLSTGMVHHPAPGTSPYAPRLEGEIYEGGPGEDKFQAGGRPDEALPDNDPPLVPPIELLTPPDDPQLPFETPTPPGMDVSYTLHSFGRSATVSVLTTDGADVVRVVRNRTLENGIDIDVNGSVLTLDLDAGPIFHVHLNTLAGNDDVTVDLGDWFPTKSRGLHVSAGDGADEVTNLGDYGFTVYGNAGNDTLRGGPGGEYLMGGAGVDRLYGNGGNDTLHVGYTEDSPPGPAPVEEGEVYDPGQGRDLVVTADGSTRYFNGRPVEEDTEGGSDTLAATFVGKRTVRRGSSYTFTVTYAAPFGDAVDRATVGEGDVTVSGPGGFTASAQLVGAKVKRKGSVLVARYRVAAPGGTFDAADNGTYTVRVGDAAVNTMAGRAASVLSISVPGNRPTGTAAADLGTFTVAARTRGRPEGATSIVRMPAP